MLRKEAIQCVSPQKGVYKQSLSGEQERWRSQTGNKPQKVVNNFLLDLISRWVSSVK